ncbi:putative permease of the major facilitator superfamily protein [Microlunatus endophyticus]|uniref:Permease of the major facilitator superfamily protein n=2 Tax=Microlunatus endophyticus TaxID=1716077 RepID=A0A917S6I3_9ACTN|nr:putative permease of the major facilitator superfamily protein [Microlunatus endophyticus]
MAIGGFAIGTVEFATMGLLPQIAHGVQVTIPQAGRLVSAYALGVVVGAPLIAVLAARLQRKLLLILLMALFAVGNFSSALATDYHLLLISRFVSGLPHGAFFGVASVVASTLAAPGRRARAVSLVFVGVTIANIAGVPGATWLGQRLGWQALFAIVAGLALVCLVATVLLVPEVRRSGPSRMIDELSALARPQVWLMLAVIGIGSGGMFAIYSYITPTLTRLSGIAESTVPWALALYGVGMTAGMLIGGRLADHSAVRTILGGLVSMVILFAVFAPLVGTGPVGAFTATFLLGLTCTMLVPALQTRLISLAPEGESLAAALSQASFNVANALGAWLGGLSLDAGMGYAGPSRIAIALPVIGIVILLIAVRGVRGPGRSLRSGVVRRRPTAESRTSCDIPG